ncbi:MAG: hypothetical protein ACXVZL_03750 [Gaiellaceae bacterium]
MSRRVVSASSTTAVRPSRGAPGPSMATWPSEAPEASRKRSIPPAAAIRSSYAAGSVGSGSQTSRIGIERSAKRRQL